MQSDKAAAAKAAAAQEGEAQPPIVDKRPSMLQIETPLITPEQLFDFNIAQVKIFQKSDRLLQDQEEPECIFPD